MSRHTRKLLALSAFNTVPTLAMRFAEPDDKSGGGADAKDKSDKKDAKDAKDQPKKIELTEDELAERIKSSTEAALRKERDTAAATKKKEDDERAAAKAKEDGDFQKLADDEKGKREKAESERDSAKLDARKLEVKDQLRDYLAEKHPDYVGVAKYIMPLVEFDLKTEAADVEKRITAAADQYVKDNPRKASAHDTPHKPGMNQAREKPTNNQNRAPARSNGVAVSRF